MFKLRSYNANDYEQIRRLFINNPTSELSYDLLAVDLFLEYSSEYCFLIENQVTHEICGIILAALNVARLNEIYKVKFLEKLCIKYPTSGGDSQTIMNYQVSSYLSQTK